MTGWKYFLLIFLSVAFLIAIPYIFNIDQHSKLNAPEKHYLQSDNQYSFYTESYRCVITEEHIQCFRLF